MASPLPQSTAPRKARVSGWNSLQRVGPWLCYLRRAANGAAEEREKGIRLGEAAADVHASVQEYYGKVSC